MRHEEKVGCILAAGLDDIVDKLNELGLRSTASRQWKATIILRNVAHDELTVLCGSDDEATLIVALQQLGSARGRRERRFGKDGAIPGDAS